MSGKEWEVFRRRGIPLIRWLVILILYFLGVLAYGEIQEPSGIPVFFSGSYPAHSQAAEILRREEELEDRTEVCFFQDCGIVTVSDGEYERSAQVLLGGILGDGTVYDWRLRGFAPKDREGCVIDEGTAGDLFGASEALGREVQWGEKLFQVRLVLPWKHRVMLVHPADRESVYTRVYVREKKGEAGADTASRFLMRHGLSGREAEEQVLKGAAAGCLWLLPSGMYLALFVYAVRMRRRGDSRIWTGISVMMAVSAAVLIWKSGGLPRDWIPGKWSDFQFWPDRLKTLTDQLKLKLMMPGSVMEAENTICAVKSMALSLTAFLMYAFGTFSC